METINRLLTEIHPIGLIFLALGAIVCLVGLIAAFLLYGKPELNIVDQVKSDRDAVEYELFINDLIELFRDCDRKKEGLHIIVEKADKLYTEHRKRCPTNLLIRNAHVQRSWANWYKTLQ